LVRQKGEGVGKRKETLRATLVLPNGHTATAGFDTDHWWRCSDEAVEKRLNGLASAWLAGGHNADIIGRLVTRACKELGAKIISTEEIEVEDPSVVILDQA
jgi:hypothetical protein